MKGRESATVKEQTGAWIQTYSGRAFDLLTPRASQVSALDIAHALAQLCRFAGHTREFYSVAQHSVIVSRAVPPAMALTALLHDAPEAYIGDMTRPLKHVAGAEFYRAVEQRIWYAIAERYHLPFDLPLEIKQADNAALFAERRDLLADCEREWGWSVAPLPEKIVPLDPWRARDLWLAEFARLRSERRTMNDNNQAQA